MLSICFYTLLSLQKTYLTYVKGHQNNSKTRYKNSTVPGPRPLGSIPRCTFTSGSNELINYLSACLHVIYDLIHCTYTSINNQHFCKLYIPWHGVWNNVYVHMHSTYIFTNSLYRSYHFVYRLYLLGYISWKLHDVEIFNNIYISSKNVQIGIT